jgi:glycosyltransferase involved in cell wall biosynthesis
MISIIIPTHDNRNLQPLIKSIEDSTYKDFEIIIVNEGLERSVQRNIGVSRAKGEYFLFLDSDMTIHPQLLFNCMVLCQVFDGLYIPEIIVGHPIKTFLRSFYNGTRVDAIRFLKRKFFIPFDEDITGFEDWDFDRRFKGTKGITNFPLYHHHKGKSNKIYYLKWFSAYKKKYPNCPELSLKYRLWTVWIEGIKKRWLKDFV